MAPVPENGSWQRGHSGLGGIVLQESVVLPLSAPPNSPQAVKAAITAVSPATALGQDAPVEIRCIASTA